MFSEQELCFILDLCVSQRVADCPQREHILQLRSRSLGSRASEISNYYNHYNTSPSMCRAPVGFYFSVPFSQNFQMKILAT